MGGSVVRGDGVSGLTRAGAGSALRGYGPQTCGCEQQPISFPIGRLWEFEKES